MRRLLVLALLLAACPEPELPEEPEVVDPFAAPADVAAPPADATVTESGLAYKILQPGTGEAHPVAASEVTVHYTGWKTDGEMFDSSAKRGKPATFPLQGVIAGWTEGLQLMHQGEKVRFWIPEDIAYQGRPGKPSGMLVFDVELLDFTAPPPAPADVAAPPDTATVTESGLAYVMLHDAEGTVTPKAEDLVWVHYSGWTTDGESFDSSVMRGEPLDMFPTQVIPGWTEGLQLMTVGDKTRLWIPEDLAYAGKKGKPQGMLVFDVELLGIMSPPVTPADVASPPADATFTESSLAYKVLRPGSGEVHPGPRTKVRVHYAGWTTDGEMFDTSFKRGEAAVFPLNRVIPGWTEGLQLMVEGEKTRFWIPVELAYDGRPGKPAGMLVFDVDLVQILD